MERSQFGAKDAAAPAKINALLLDDSDFDRQRIRRLGVTSGLPLVIEEVPTLAAMSEAMDRQSFDLMLIDYRLSEGDGLSALQLADAHPSNHAAAKIMISGNERVGVAVSAFKMGCHDYLSKQDISADSLRTAVMHALQIQADPPAPRPDMLLEMRAALITALRHPEFQRNLQPIIAKGLRKAIKELQLHNLHTPSAELVTFLDAFTGPENFAFREDMAAANSGSGSWAK